MLDKCLPAMLSFGVKSGGGVKLTVLGCNGPVPRPGQACSGYLLQHNRLNVLLDCGSGVLSSLQKHLDYWRVDAIVISHMHADHCFDLLSYRTALRLDMYRSLSVRVPLYLPPGGSSTLSAMATVVGHAESYFEDSFDICEYGVDQPLLLGNKTGTGSVEENGGGLRLDFRPTVHRVRTYGVRITAGAVLAYSADSGVTPALVELAKGADLFLCEATFQRETNFPNRPHLKAAETGEIAREAGARSLLLTHIWHQLDPRRSVEEAAAGYSGPIAAAEEGRTYIITQSLEAAGETNWQHARRL